VPENRDQGIGLRVNPSRRAPSSCSTEETKIQEKGSVNEHGKNSVFYSAVEPDSRIAFFLHFWDCRHLALERVASRTAPSSCSTEEKKGLSIDTATIRVFTLPSRPIP